MSAIVNGFLLKSKTINTTVLAGALVTILNQLGVSIPVEAVSAGFVVLSFIMRLITNEPLEDK